MSEALSMGIHESQSLFWERMVGQSEAFWKHCGPILREHLPQTSDCSNADFYNFVNKVLIDGLIRVDADELTYPLHVCVRFEIEKGLFDGSIAVEDLPRVWNDKMEEYLGVVPPNDTLGVLQDVHWSDGSFGYFPSYTLGAMYACQVSTCSGPRREGPRTDSEKSSTSTRRPRSLISRPRWRRATSRSCWRC